jgi:hypothetical protein
MKWAMILSSSFLIITPGFAQQFNSWNLKEIAYGFAGQPDTRTYTVTGPEVKKLDGQGGELWFWLTPNSHPACRQLFQVGWNFSDNIQVVQRGQQINVQVFDLIPGNSFSPCYLQGKGWAYDGGYLITQFLGGNASHFVHQPAYKKYWGPDSPYLFALGDGKGIEVYPVDPGYPVSVGTGIGSFIVQGGIPGADTSNPPTGNITFEISKGGVFKYTVMYAFDAYQAPGNLAGGIGLQWIVGESGWLGIWTRRGQTNVFDAVWVAGDARIAAEMTVQLAGNQVTVIRRKSTDGNDCTYTGTISADGQMIYGSYGCTNYPGPYPWSAMILRQDPVQIRN